MVVKHLSSNRHPEQSPRFTVYSRISQIWRVYIASTFLNHRDTDWSNLYRYPTHILSHNHYRHMCICEGVGTQKPLELTNIWQNLTTFMLSTCAKVLESLRYGGIKSMQVPHAYSVSQPLPSPVYIHILFGAE